MTDHHRRTSIFLSATLASVTLFGIAGVSRAGSFTAGNLVVYRVGDGTATLVNTGNAVFLDEYTPSGTFVQSVALPTTSSGVNSQLIASGTAASEGLLTRSVNGQYLLLTGYARNLGGGTSLSGTTATAVPRTVGRVKYDGTIDTSTALSDFASANNPRSACSTDGLDIWVGGAAGGVRYTRYSAFGSTSSAQLSTDSTNIEQVGIFSGQLYASTQKGSLRVATVGSGTPTAAGQTITNLPGFPTSTDNPNAFFFADLDGSPGLDTLYVADDIGGQLQKFSLVSGSWTGSGTITAANAHGLTGVASGTTVTLYATGTSGTDGTLYKFVDITGYNANVSGSASAIATAGANQTFRGVALAPVATLPPSPTPTGTRTRTATSSSAPSTPTRTSTSSPTPGTSVPASPTPAVTATLTQSSTATRTTSPTPLGATTTPAAEGAFEAGNIVVYRVGDGVESLSNNGNSVFVDEYTPAGTFVRAVAVGIKAQGSTGSGSAIEGLLSNSADGQYVLLAGYATTAGSTLSTTSCGAGGVNRIVGVVKYDGTVDISTVLTDFSCASNPRSATSTDGAHIWVAGNGGGARYTTLGGATSEQVSTGATNVRQVLIFDGQLYAAINGSNVSTIGMGLPTSGDTVTTLPGLASSGTSPDGFFFAALPGGTVLYIADDAAGVIHKWSLVSGTWSDNGTLSYASARAVVGTVSGTTVTLYLNNGGSTISTLTDSSGYNAMITGTATSWVTAPANEVFRGIALAPVSAVAAPTSTPIASSPPTRTITPGGPTLTVSPTPTRTATSAFTLPPATATAPASATPAVGSFTAGNIVVYRVGDGVTVLAGVGAPVFLDEFTPAGILVQSVPLPTSASGTNKALIASGTAGTEGQLTRSADGRYLLLTGYNAAPGTANLTKSTADSVARTVGRVDAAAKIDTTTALTDFSSGDKPRGAASTNGTDIWLGCGGKATGTTDSVHYTTLGSATSIQLSATFGDSREINIYGGQLYISSQNNPNALIGAIGTGTPTTAPQTTTAIPGFAVGGAPEGFFFADLDGSPGLDTLYVADEVAGIEKWSLVGGNWTLNNALAPTSDVLYGLTGVVSGNALTLYATGSGSNNDQGTLYALADSSGYNSSMNGTLNLLVTAGPNRTFRGVAPVPVQPMASACVGDCDGNGVVKINEVQACINIFLAAPLSTCANCDQNGDLQVKINEVQGAVNSFLDASTCPHVMSQP